MQDFHFQVYVGPTPVRECSERLRAAAMSWQNVTVEGTEHIHFKVTALYRAAADREVGQWFTRAGMSWALLPLVRVPGVQFLRAVEA